MTIGIGVGAFIAGVILSDKVKAVLSSLKAKALGKALGKAAEVATEAKDEVKKVL